MCTAAIATESTVLRLIYRLKESATAFGSGSNYFLDPDIKLKYLRQAAVEIAHAVQNCRTFLLLLHL